jgi:hypothetical protein
MLLPPMRWAHRLWALPWLTVLGPAEPFYEQPDRRAPTRVPWAWQSIHGVVRWRPGRVVGFGADSRDAALALRHQVRTARWASRLTRLNLAAALYDPPPTREAGQLGRPRRTGARRPTLEATWAVADTP